MERHKTFFVDTIEEIKYCNTSFFQLTGSEFELPFEVKATTGKHDYNSCEDCKQVFTDIVKNTEERFKTFPLCCEGHRNLIKQKWFNRDKFINIPFQVASKIIFTHQHIINKIDADDWFTDITNYIDYVIMSFGKMPLDCGEPFRLRYYFVSLTEFLEQEELTTKLKRNKILEYIKSYQNTNEITKSDLNNIIITYHKWLKIFPFNISYFKELRPRLEKNLPILAGEPIYNPYVGLSKAKIQTQSELIERLINYTKEILSNINSKELREKGIILDNARHTLDLVNEAHRIKQTSLLNEFVREEKKYINILKIWLENEKEYFKEISQLVPDSSNVNKAEIKLTKAQILKNTISKFGFLELESVSTLSSEKQDKLIELIFINKLPYAIAMFDYLGFISYLEHKYFATKYKLYREISKWFNSDKDGRAVKGNISSLLKNSTENLDRYTAYKHTESVKKDYQKLK